MPPSTSGRKRNRQASSCEPCRSRRKRCDRVFPCSSCSFKSLECSYAAGTAAPVYSQSERSETEFLRQEVARLQAIIESRPSIGSSLGLKGSSSGSSSQFDDSSGVEELEEDPDLANHDIVQAMSQLTIKQYLEGQQTPADTNPTTLVVEARKLLEEPTSSRTEKSNSNPPPIFPFTRTSLPTNITTTMQQLPSREDEAIAMDNYWLNMNWYCRPLTKAQYTNHSQHVYKSREEGKQANPFSLAIVFAFVGIGLSGLALREPKYEYRARFVPNLLDLAATSLQLGKFIENPSIEAIRTLLVLSNYYLALSEGNSASTGVAFITLTVQSCLQLQLHRDPDKLISKSFTPQEIEDRRRLFWFTYTADVQISSVTGRPYTLLHARDTDTKLPLDIHDDEIGIGIEIFPFSRETGMTSLIARIKIAQIAEKICCEAFGIKPITYARIKSLDAELQELEIYIAPIFSYPIPPEREFLNPHLSFHIYIIQLIICQERLRLHRPYLSRSYLHDEEGDSGFKYSQIVCLETAKRTLQIHASRLCGKPWAGVQYMSICACIVLAVDVLERPIGVLAEEHREFVRNAIIRLEGYSDKSNLCRRGVKVLNFLLQKDAAARYDLHNDNVSKRCRTSTYAPMPTQISASQSNFNLPPFTSPYPISNSYTDTYQYQLSSSQLPSTSSSSTSFLEYPSSSSFNEEHEQSHHNYYDPSVFENHTSVSSLNHHQAYFPLPPVTTNSENQVPTTSTIYSPPMDPDSLRFSYFAHPGSSSGFEFDFNFPYDGASSLLGGTNPSELGFENV